MRQNFNKKMRYSIRKFSVGVASVAVGAVLALGGVAEDVSAESYVVNPSEETPFAEQEVVVEDETSKGTIVGVDNVREDVTEIPHDTTYNADGSLAFKEQDVQVEGQNGSETAETIYDVHPEYGSLSDPQAGETIVVDSVTEAIGVGNVEEVREAIAHETVYSEAPEQAFLEKDVKVEGQDGANVTEKTYDVDADTGEVSNPVVTDERVEAPVTEDIGVGNTYANDKAIEHDTTYHADAELDFKEQDVRVEGEDGMARDTTTFEVDREEGYLKNPVQSLDELIKNAVTEEIAVGNNEKVTIIDNHETTYIENDGLAFREVSELREGKDGYEIVTRYYQVDEKTGDFVQDENGAFITNDIDHTDEDDVLETDRIVEIGTVENTHEVTAFEVIELKDSDLKAGVSKVVQEGRDGVEQVVYDYSVNQNGELVDPVELSRETLVEVINAIVLVGTGAPVETPVTVEIGDQEIELSKEKPEVAPIELTNEPTRVVVSFSENPQTEMNVAWYTKDNLDDSVVLVSTSKDFTDAQVYQANTEEVSGYFGERDGNGNYIFEVTDRDRGVVGYYTDAELNHDNYAWTDRDYPGSNEKITVVEHSNQVTLDELTPNTVYYYRLGSPSTENMSNVGTFKTAGEANDVFKFIQMTDTQNSWHNENVRNEAAYGADTLARALEVASADGSPVDFIMHTGDLVDHANDEDEWNDILNQMQESLLSAPIVVAPGNHDEAGSTGSTDFIDHINVPAANEANDGGTYYSYDYNGSHFVVLNTNDADGKPTADNPDEGMLGQAQLAWLEADLAEARENDANWIVVSHHKPLYSSSYHSLQDGDVQASRDALMSLFDKYNVDLVLNGHDHVLTTTKPLEFNGDRFASAEVAEDANEDSSIVTTDGTIFAIPNTAGTKNYNDVYNHGLDYLHDVRPNLSNITEEDLAYYNSFFRVSDQPNASEGFGDTHSNYREGAVQHFNIFTVNQNEIVVETYAIAGDLDASEERVVTKIDEYKLIEDNTVSEVLDFSRFL